MYVHLGETIVVRSCSIIGIFDLERTSVSRITKDFLNGMDKKDVITVSFEMPKSFVICKEKEKTIAYITAISPSTLKKRSKIIKSIS